LNKIAKQLEEDQGERKTYQISNSSWSSSTSIDDRAETLAEVVEDVAADEVGAVATEDEAVVESTAGVEVEETADEVVEATVAEEEAASVEREVIEGEGCSKESSPRETRERAESAGFGAAAVEAPVGRLDNGSGGMTGGGEVTEASFDEEAGNEGVDSEEAFEEDEEGERGEVVEGTEGAGSEETTSATGVRGEMSVAGEERGDVEEDTEDVLTTVGERGDTAGTAEVDATSTEEEEDAGGCAAE